MRPPTWAGVLGRRLRRHGLAAPFEASPADVVRAMCGAHAQVLSAGELSVALRLAGADRTHVQAALWTDHTLVKTFGPRGTVHLLPTADLPMWTGALSALPEHSPFTDDVRMTPEQTDGGARRDRGRARRRRADRRRADRRRWPTRSGRGRRTG